MSHRAFLNQLIGPLLARRGDVVLVGDLVVLKPVHNLVRGIRLATVAGPDTRSAIWEIHLLCSPSASPSRPIADGFVRPLPPFPISPFADQFLGQADLKATSQSICNDLELAIQTTLAEISTPEALYRYLSDGTRRMDWPEDPDPPQSLALYLATGRFFEARNLYDEHRAQWFQADELYMESMHLLMDKRTRVLCRLLEIGAHEEIGTMLHDLERISIRQFKVDRLWEPTAFPFESGAF